MLYYDGIDLSEGIAVVKSNNNKECIMCYYWLLLLTASRQKCKVCVFIN